MGKGVQGLGVGLQEFLVEEKAALWLVAPGRHPGRGGIWTRL